MTTYRERREARAARLREWAEKREAKAEEQLAKVDAIASMIPMGQPILVGHHSEGRARRDQERIVTGMRKGIEHRRTAESMSSKADNIEAAAERAIYSDDHDAAARLDERIAELEAERERIKAFNASCRAGTPAIAMLTEDERREWFVGRQFYPKILGFPSYKLTNLSSNINRLKKRRAGL